MGLPFGPTFFTGEDMNQRKKKPNIHVKMVTILIGVLLMASPPAKAQELGLNAWGMEFAPLKEAGVEHMAFYPGLSLSLTYEAGPWALSPSLGLEWAADAAYWGLMAMLYADHPINDHLGLDIILAVMHDQMGNDWTNAEVFVGAGTGISWFIHDRAVLTPNVLVYYGLRTNTWALAPGVNLWVSLEDG
ncbi:MAG: hypothetical protein CMH56_01570 [Myxococcales bacterium]|nr:hypothetical protein [Myxococcales bacterium]